MLMRATSSKRSSPVSMPIESQRLLTAQAPIGSATMAGCGLWPRSSSVLSIRSVMGVMGSMVELLWEHSLLRASGCAGVDVARGLGPSPSLVLAGGLDLGRAPGGRGGARPLVGRGHATTAGAGNNAGVGGAGGRRLGQRGVV